MNYHLETNLSSIKNLASVREKENYRFRTFLKGKNDEKVDRIVHRLHDELSRQIDCTLCGNCCCQLNVELHPKDIVALAGLENITPGSYRENYCKEYEDGEMLLKSLPCRYLDEKKCRIYENRPEECRFFPYTDKKGFISRSLGMIDFYEVCPKVFNLMEILKDELRFRR